MYIKKNCLKRTIFLALGTSTQNPTLTPVLTIKINSRTFKIRRKQIRESHIIKIKIKKYFVECILLLCRIYSRDRRPSTVLPPPYRAATATATVVPPTARPNSPALCLSNLLHVFCTSKQNSLSPL